jgi:hypothetical protein
MINVNFTVTVNIVSEKKNTFVPPSEYVSIGAQFKWPISLVTSCRLACYRTRAIAKWPHPPSRKDGINRSRSPLVYNSNSSTHLWHKVCFCTMQVLSIDPTTSLKFASPCIIIQFKQINQLDATISPVYYLTFMYSATCYGRPHAHHQELNNCSSSLWFHRWSVVAAVLLVVVGPAGPTTTNSTAITTLRRQNQNLLLQLFISWWWAWGRPKYVEL